jgi:hypothetical protein
VVQVVMVEEEADPVAQALVRSLQELSMVEVEAPAAAAQLLVPLPWAVVEASRNSVV